MSGEPAQVAMTDDALTIDILVQSPLWQREPEAESTVTRAISAAASRLSTSGGEVAIVLTDDSAIRTLNRDWRGFDKPTNVLSFPASRSSGTEPAMLGDIVIAYETLERECRAENKQFLHHLAHLAVHGFLHLMGYDHQTDSEADDMERIEISILSRLQVPDPYLAREAN
jgi:probable rRNA maturation factor